MIASKLDHYSFEQGPIRPPSEAYSLLIRATRNCPWNRCLFCPVFKEQKFELRLADDVVKDILIAKAIADEIKAMTWKMGYPGRLREVAAAVHNQPQYHSSVRSVALWLWAGGEAAFLQDANTLIMRTPDLVRVLEALKTNFPELKTITSYARSKTAAKRSASEMRELKAAGLSRLHMGVESGSDRVLEFMQKGATAADHISGGRNAKEGGILLCTYIMPGLGGRKMSTEHVAETASVLNEVDPDYIRLRSLMVSKSVSMWPAMPLWLKVDSGEFELQTDDEMVRELGDLIDRLEVTSYLSSDHMLNLLPELEGKFPEAKTKCLSIINRYLALSSRDRLNYRLGRRSGYYHGLDDIYDAAKYQKVDEAINRISTDGPDAVEQVIQRIKESFM